jgi:hypothetical protein
LPAARQPKLLNFFIFNSFATNKPQTLADKIKRRRFFAPPVLGVKFLRRRKGEKSSALIVSIKRTKNPENNLKNLEKSV